MADEPETHEPEGLAHLYVEGRAGAGAREPFCAVEARGDQGTVLRGMLPPDEMREMALAWLRAAEGAEQDAAVLAVTTDVLDDETGQMLAAAVVIKLRERRGITR